MSVIPVGNNSHTKSLFPLQAERYSMGLTRSSVSNLQIAFQFLLQVVVILAACRIAGKVAVKCGQPQVVGEMIAGILLGPSLLGLYLPEAQRWLFPSDTKRILYAVAQVGLALYMFIVGLEFRMDIVRQNLRSAVAVSVAGMVAPFILGLGLGWAFFHWTDLFPAKTALMEGMLFVGASLCITAFPVLARLIEFKKLKSSAMGSVSLGAGAVNDACAWCLLSVVLASMDHNWNGALLTIVGGAAFIGFVAGVVRPVLHRCESRLVRNRALTAGGAATVLAVMGLGAVCTELIGLHAVLGAFAVGVVVPRGVIVRDLVRRIQPFTVALLLPLFFAYSGLNTKIGLLNSASLWMMCLAVLGAAIAGKVVACWLAARATGIANREALGIGILMNVRGLMELIIINIGLERGIISPGLFAILVIMAIVTTVMASPLFDWLAGKAALQPALAKTSPAQPSPSIT
jgi:Kef-type K+ transport system membrane component KefB